MEQLDLVIENNDIEFVPDIAETHNRDIPLAARLRPQSFEEFVGQQHILGPEKLLRRAIDADRFTSIILHGPPGIGKTSIAELIATKTDSVFVRHSGVTSTVGDIRKEIASAVFRKHNHNKNTVLFIDELHRFNRAQQDVLLPDVENGNIRLIGATTQNPHFYIVGPLLSRSLVFQLEALSPEDLRKILQHAIEDERGFGDRKVEVTEDAMKFITEICEGDARRALNALEIAVLTTSSGKKGVIKIDLKTAEASVQKKVINYGDDGHYDTISAFIKSMRGSDPDAAVYWLAKMLHSGEEIMFIARRIVIFASEDIGNADPRALTLAVSAMQAVEMIGMPEARIILSHAVTYCATAPKSNASYMAIDESLKDIRNQRVQPVPKHLKDSHYSGAKKMGHGENYQYPHNFKDNFVPQEYMGIPKCYYKPGSIGYEAKIKERIEYWNSLRKESDSEHDDG